MIYFLIFLTSLALSVIFTLASRKIALKFDIVDRPDYKRKIHKKPIPLLGGLAIFISFFLALFIFNKYLLIGDLNIFHWLGFFIGALFLLFGGLLDDKYNLSPKWQIIWPILAALFVVFGGVNIEKVTNPMGGFIMIPAWISSMFIFIWIMSMTYTTKLLDGLDGLATGVSAIGGLIIFLFTISSAYYQPDIAVASLIFFSVLLGFLFFNFNPAKIFLGESGSLLLGYILGVLAIISGGKIAIALLVVGLPALDVLWTIIRRIFSGKNPFKHSDRKHLHHRLIDLGLGQKKAVLFFYAVSAFFGFSSLFLQSRGKLWALLGIFGLMILLLLLFYFLDKKGVRFKERLLLHVCCAPCASYLILDKLIDKYEVIVYYSNSNIDSKEEFKKRLYEVQKITKEYNLRLKVDDYNYDKWLERCQKLKDEPEKGARCKICYRDRLERTALLAKRMNIKRFFTTLLVSSYKNDVEIRKIGSNLSKEYDLLFLSLDIDKKEFSKASLVISKNKNYYRQNYCGCEFSRR
jgi:UDP-GlcNAc:undecaprenyl-phosphate/decaprenyl-phosphate GlcNAc-1-phosphate transferase